MSTTAAPLDLVLCGTGFCPLQLAALARLQQRFRVAGVWAAAGDAAQALARQTGVPLWTGPADFPAGLGAAWVAPGGHGVPAGQRAAELLERGLPVLAEAPLSHDELAGCVRQARRAGTLFRVAAGATRLPGPRRFLGAAKALQRQQPIRYVTGSCTRGAVSTLLHLLGEAIGGLRPAEFAAPARLADSLLLLSGQLAGVPLHLRLRDEVPAQPGPAALATVDITLGTTGGELSLRGSDGQVVWLPRAGARGVPLGGPDPLPARAGLSRAGNGGGDLAAFAEAITAAPAGSGVADVQYHLTLSRLHDELLAALGAPPPPAATNPIEVAALAAATVEAAGDEGRQHSPADLPPRDAIDRAALNALRQPGRPAVALSELPAALHRLEAISLNAIAGLLKSAQALPVGAARATDEILSALGAAPRHAWLARRWLAALADRGLLTINSEDRYRWADLCPAPVAAAALPEAYAALGFPPAMADVHQETLAQLGPLIRDEIAIQLLLFRNQPVLDALAAYQDNVFTAYLNAACGELVRRCALSHPAPLRVIELGGGAGLTTAATLEALRGRAVDYLFTDVSRVFTVAAQERFAGRPGFRCGLLDLNADFAAQGVPPQAADLVLAGNVLHNAAHVGRTLRRIRRLLAPGGWLVFTESTCENYAVLTSMQFLLSPAADAPPLGAEDRRAGTDQVFVDAAGWREELLAAGFLPQFELPAPDCSLGAAGQQLFFAIAY